MTTNTEFDRKRKFVETAFGASAGGTGKLRKKIKRTKTTLAALAASARAEQKKAMKEVFGMHFSVLTPSSFQSDFDDGYSTSLQSSKKSM